MIYKHLNFQNDGNGKAKLFKSLAHSLRISPTEKNKISPTKKLEWDENLAHKNLIYSPDLGSKPIRLDSLDEEQKIKIQNSFFETINDEQKSKDKNSDVLDTLRKYKAKVNKWLNSITDDSDPLRIFLSKILEEKKFIDVESEINTLTQFEFARKNQKTETVKKFLELHNKVLENKSDISRNKIFIQEAFFKIPSRNNVEISTTDLISNIHSFYKVNFPDYPIKLIVFHGDEIGNHPHIFVDAKNKRTEKYDLLVAQKKFVNDNIEKIKEEHPNAKPLEFLRDENDYFNKKMQAQYFQTLFYQHSNEMLAKYDVEAKKLEKTDENNARMRLIEEDAKKPKIERQFSFYNAETIRLNGNYERAQINASNALKEEEIIDKRLEQKKKDLAAATTQLLDAQSEIITLNNNLPSLRSEKETLTNKIPELQKAQKELKRKNDELLPSAIKYDEISDAYDQVKPKYEKIVEDYKLIIDRSQKQIIDGLREFFSVMWGLMEYGKGKLTYSSLNPFAKKKLKGAPKDIHEWDSRIELLTRMAVDKTIDAFIALDVLIPKEPLAQAFKEKVIEERYKPGRIERHDFLGKGVDLTYTPPELKASSNSKQSNDLKAEKLFSEAEMDQKIKDTLKRIKAGKP
ncbi:MAG: Mobilization protein [Pseudomonas lundensis]